MALATWKDLCFDASDPKRIAGFWGELLGLTLEVQDTGDAVLRGEHPGQTMWCNAVPEPKTVKNRVHLDLVLPSYAPLVQAGARVLEDHHTDRFRWTVLADPEGNELCVFPEGQQAPTALVVDAVEPPSTVAGWWADVLGAQVAEAPDGMRRWLAEVPGLPFEVWKFVGVPDGKSVKNRWHWDVTCADVDALVASGARVVRTPEDGLQWHVLVDPWGNEFCAFAP